MAAGDGNRLGSQMHCGVETCQLYAVPEGAPYEPGGVIIVDDKVWVDGVPIVAGCRAVGILLPVVRGHDAAFVFPHIRAQRATAEQTDGRAVLAECRATVGHPPASVPLDDIGCPDVVLEAWYGVGRPTGDD